MSGTTRVHMHAVAEYVTIQPVRIGCVHPFCVRYERQDGSHSAIPELKLGQRRRNGHLSESQPEPADPVH